MVPGTPPTATAAESARADKAGCRRRAVRSGAIAGPRSWLLRGLALVQFLSGIFAEASIAPGPACFYLSVMLDKAVLNKHIT